MNKKVVCIIPARYASTRFCGKPLEMVRDMPLVMWTYKSAVNSRAFEAVHVATDNERIFSVVQEYGGSAIMTDPQAFTGTDRVHDAVRKLQGDYFVNLQGDEPMIPGTILREFSEATLRMDNNTLLSMVSYATIEDMENPHVVKVVLTAEREALYFSRSPIPYARDASACRGYRHAGIYGFTRVCLDRFCAFPVGDLERTEGLEQLRALEYGMRIMCLIRDYDSISIDTQEDLEAFKQRVEQKKDEERCGLSTIGD